MMTDHPEDPKDNDRVPATTYAWMIPVATRVARRHGYAIGVHGSMSRDLDLIAVPWVETANEPIDLLKELAEYLGGLYGPFVAKPCGRVSANIRFEGAWHFIDISFTPKVNHEELSRRQGQADREVEGGDKISKK